MKTGFRRKPDCHLPANDEAISLLIQAATSILREARAKRRNFRGDTKFSNGLRCNLSSHIRAGEILAGYAPNYFRRVLSIVFAAYRRTADATKYIITGGRTGA